MLSNLQRRGKEQWENSLPQRKLTNFIKIEPFEFFYKEKIAQQIIIWWKKLTLSLISLEAGGGGEVDDKRIMLSILSRVSKEWRGGKEWRGQIKK